MRQASSRPRCPLRTHARKSYPVAFLSEYKIPRCRLTTFRPERTLPNGIIFLNLTLNNDNNSPIISAHVVVVEPGTMRRCTTHQRDFHQQQTWQQVAENGITVQRISRSGILFIIHSLTIIKRTFRQRRTYSWHTALLWRKPAGRWIGKHSSCDCVINHLSSHASALQIR